MGEKALTFVPAPLPPRSPIGWMPDLRTQFDRALPALRRIDSVSSLLPHTARFRYAGYIEIRTRGTEPPGR